MAGAGGMTPRILVIAGSDSGGGAGIQADIRTVTMLGGHAMTALTAITAQNTVGVQAVMPVPAAIVRAQIDSVADDIGVDAVKIGMLGSAEVAHAVADWLEGRRVPIVLDPVLVATSGAALADAGVVAALDRLAALATVVTPNTPELERLSGRTIASEADRRPAAEALLHRTGARAVLAKGGHGIGDLGAATLRDTLYERDGGAVRETIWQSERIDTRHTHGTGCTLASAIATGLATGLSLNDAITRGIAFVRAAIRAAPGFGAGHGPMGHHAVRPADLAPRRSGAGVGGVGD